MQTFKKFIYLFLAVVGLHCDASFSLAVANVGSSLAAAHGLLVEVASRCRARLSGMWTQRLWLLGTGEQAQ